MNLMLQPYRRYFDFNGRSRRSEFWLFYLFTLAVSMGLNYASFAANSGNGGSSHGSGVMWAIIGLLVVFSMFSFIPALAVQVRRLHDTGRSAWWLLIGLIPLVGIVVLVVFNILPGTTGPNRFGSDPKGGGETEPDRESDTAL